MKSRQWFIAVLKVIGLIGFYYFTSIGITFYNQNFIRNFDFPLTLTLCHFVVEFVIAIIIRSILMPGNKIQFVRLDWKKCLGRVLPTAVAGSIDIALSNWSFEFITISLYTMTKSSSILFILFFSIIFKIEKPKWSTGILVFLIAGGVFLFTYQSSQFNLAGFILVLSASCVSGIRWSLTQLLAQKEEIGLSNPLDMMYYVMPFRALTILPLVAFKEGTEVAVSPYFFATGLDDNGHTGRLVVTLIFGGCVLAFLLEFAEFLVVRYTSSLTLAIAGIFKELCTLLLAAFFKNDVITPVNWVGVALCLCGISVSVYAKQRNTDESKTSPTRKAPEEQEMSNITSNEADFPDEEQSPLVVKDTADSEDDEDSNVIFSARSPMLKNNP